jgi:hypothetical protein
MLHVAVAIPHRLALAGPPPKLKQDVPEVNLNKSKSVLYCNNFIFFIALRFQGSF